MTRLERLHAAYIYPRRVRRLCDRLAELLLPGSRVLDVGCGDGWLTSLIAQRRADVVVEGLDVLVRPRTHIPVKPFDGRVIPYSDASIDMVMLVDVLHHAASPFELLREAVRVADKAVLIKDHACGRIVANLILRFTERVANARHGVAVPGNYWTRRQWFDVFAALRLTSDVWDGRLGLYPWPAGLVFNRSVDFIARLRVDRR